MKATLKANLKVVDTMWGKTKMFRKDTEIVVNASPVLEGVYCVKDEQGREYLIHEEFLNFTKEKETKIKDNVNPQHYKNGTKGIETIDTISEFLREGDFVSYCLGNVIKYVSRYEYKNGLEDLKKAKWYSEKILTTLFDSNADMSYISNKEAHVLNVLNKEQTKGYLKGNIISRCKIEKDESEDKSIEVVKVREIVYYLELLIDMEEKDA